MGLIKSEVGSLVTKAREILEKILDRCEPNYSKKVYITGLDQIDTGIKSNVEQYHRLTHSRL